MDSQFEIYHERQSKRLCALHALNNLFQSHVFNKNHLDDICMRLCPDSYWFNPHRSVTGWGNYDVNVVIAALQSKNMDTVWFDKRKNLESINISMTTGFILNFPANLRVGTFEFPIKRGHWIAVQKVNELYYNLDSRLNQPIEIGNEPELLEYFRKELENPLAALLIVIPGGTSTDQIFYF